MEKDIISLQQEELRPRKEPLYLTMHERHMLLEIVDRLYPEWNATTTEGGMILCVNSAHWHWFEFCVMVAARKLLQGKDVTDFALLVFAHPSPNIVRWLHEIMFPGA